MERSCRVGRFGPEAGNVAPRLSRRTALLSAAGALLASPAIAQPFPSRPIRMLVGFAAGGATDMVARLYAPYLQHILGGSIIVDNRPGGSQLLAIRALMASPPDGYAVFVGTGSSLVQGPGVRTDLPYDPLKDFSPIAMMGETPAILVVNPQLPIHSVADLIAYAKANPGRLNYGSAGVGSAGHLQVEMMRQVTGIDVVHVPFRADQDITREVMGGALQFGLAVANGAVALVEAGRLRAIGVMGTERIAALNDVPTLQDTNVEGVRDVGMYTLYGLVGPAGMPTPIVDQMNEAVVKAAADPEVGRRMRERFFVPQSSSPAGLAQLIEREMPRWRELGRTLNLQLSGG